MRKLKKKLFRFCPYCGSQNVKRDLPKGWKILHKQCLSCGRHWELKLDLYNDFDTTQFLKEADKKTQNIRRGSF